MNTKTLCGSLLSLALLAGVSVAQDAPAKLTPTDKDALQAHVGQSVTVEGKVMHAAWSKSGAVCNITFEGNDFVAAVFKKNKDKLDEAFNGDLANTLEGATVRLSGKLAKYGGRDEKYTDATQLILSMPNQITVLTPATQPGTAAGPAPTTEPMKP